MFWEHVNKPTKLFQCGCTSYLVLLKGKSTQLSLGEHREIWKKNIPVGQKSVASGRINTIPSMTEFQKPLLNFSQEPYILRRPNCRSIFHFGMDVCTEALNGIRKFFGVAKNKTQGFKHLSISSTWDLKNDLMSVEGHEKFDKRQFFKHQVWIFFKGS